MPSPQTSPLASATALPVSAQGYPITIGAGGAGYPPGGSPVTKGSAGNPSVFSTITSTAGGGGATSAQAADAGGSGGGGRGSNPTGGAGNTPPVSPSREIQVVMVQQVVLVEAEQHVQEILQDQVLQLQEVPVEQDHLL